MSSASAGKFQDHYEVLGVDHKAAPEAIQVAYSRLAEKYHPKTGDLPNPEKYESVTLAFEVLSDPELRQDFNKLKGIGEEDKPKFSGLAFFEAYQRDTHLRIGLLCVLYDRRRSKPFTPSLSMRHLEAIFGASTQELNFALWYLKQRDLVTADDKSSLQISVAGMDYLEANPPAPALVMPMIKASGLVGHNADAEEEEDLLEVEPVPVIVEAPPRPAATPWAAGSAARIGSVLARRSEPVPAVETPVEAEPVEKAPEVPPTPVQSQRTAGSAARIGDLLARRKVG